MSNTIIEAMKSRRSCRAFKSDPVPRELVEQVAEAEQSIPEMVADLSREEMRRMYKDGKLTAIEEQRNLKP